MSSVPLSPVRILVVDDDNDLRQTVARRFERSGMTVTTAVSAEEALQNIERSRCDVALVDLQLPGMNGIELLARLKERQPGLEVLMVTAHGSMDSAIAAMKQGAYDYITKPFHFADLEIHIEKAAEKARLARREQHWLQQLAFESPRYRLIGSSPAMPRVVQLIEKVAPMEATVLIRGASGTGKELVARAIHYNSARRAQQMVTINCAALQETLLESELFGHEKGSFTGATQAKAGLVEVAEEGTLFIDEIAEMAPGLQAKLLRVLEDGHYRRVGSTQEARADVRLVAATHQPLEEAIQEGKFREDLFYRLNVITIKLPSLRERPQDIPELVEHFLTTRQVGPVRFQIDPQALAALQRYDWPGNVRELANVLERAQILAEEQRITLEDLPETIVDSEAPPTELARNPDYLSEMERRHVAEILKRVEWNKVHAASALGISRRALYRLIDKYKLSENS